MNIRIWKKDTRMRSKRLSKLCVSLASTFRNRGERWCALLALCVMFVIAGCTSGPIATSGTQGLPHDQLATVHVIKHSGVHEWQGKAVHVETFSVGGVQYRMPDETRDFLVSPGEHTFRVDYGMCIHGAAPIRDFTDDGVFAGPYGEFKATVEPGHYYVVVGSSKLSSNNGVQTEHGLVPATQPSKPQQ